MARHIAKNIVKAGLADRAEIQISYAIGSREPVSLFIDLHGTHKVDTKKIQEAVKKLFDLRPSEIIKYLDLKRPIFRRACVYGHFGHEDEIFTWEKTDRADELKKECGL